MLFASSTRSVSVCLALGVLAALPTPPRASAQVNGPGPSDPSLFDTVINLPPAPDIGNDVYVGGVGTGTTQLNIADGGSAGSSLTAGYNSEVNINGGTVGSYFGAVNGGEVNISGGSVGSNFHATWGSVVDISGGTFDLGFRAAGRSEVSISGGRFGKSFDADSNSTVAISGGAFGINFDANSGSYVELVGGEFQLNGEAYSDDSITLPNGSFFTGTLEDGSAFIFSPEASDLLVGVKLTTVPLPMQDRTPILIGAGSSPPLSGLRAGQTLLLQAGGVLPDSFEAVDATLNITGGNVGEWTGVAGSVVNISGGAVDDNFHLYSGSVVNISGGVVGDDIDAHIGSVLNISGGVLGESFAAESGSVVNISGGAVGGYFQALSGSLVGISGGTVSSHFFALPGSEVYISGGTLGSNFEVEGGEVSIIGGTFSNTFNIASTKPSFTASGGKVRISGGTFGVGFGARSASDVELIGGEFQLNGEDYTGGTITFSAGDTFTGTLADGSAFIFTTQAFDSLDSVKLTAVALPDLETTPIVVEADSPARPPGLRAGQTLTLQAGGTLGKHFEVFDATLNVTGGSLGDGAGAVRSEVNIGGGTVGDGFNVYSDTEVNISGGTIGDHFRAYPGSEVNISGGTVGDHFRADPGSEVNISGGAIGVPFTTYPNSDVELMGGDFQINGEPYQGGATISLSADDLFTGTLADGSAFIFARDAFDHLDGVTLTPVALPEPVTSPIVIEAGSPPRPSGLRAGQTLTLQAGGMLSDNFEAVDATLNITDGNLGDGAGAVRSEVNISGGTVGDGFNAFSGSVVNISGGAVGDRFEARSNSEVNISGGKVGNDFDVRSDSEVNISGGTVGKDFSVIGGEMNISGGTVGDNFEALSGSVNIRGTEFFLDGEPILALVPGEAFLINERSGITNGTFDPLLVLSGKLADGSEFNFGLSSRYFSGRDYFSSDVTLTVTLVALGLPGDYNNDGVVDPADYTVWRDAEGTAVALINETVTPGEVTIEDYQVWAENYGAILSPTTTAVPEPAGVILIAMVVWTLVLRHRRG